VTDEKPFDGWAILEEWRPLVGFEGLYEVSDHGRIRRVGRAARTGAGRGGGAVLGRVLKDHPLRGSRSENAYRTVQLWRLGEPHNVLVHVAVAAAFLGPCPNGKEVNHQDGVKANNAAPNLEYMTRSENMLHAYATGLRQTDVCGRGHPFTPDNTYRRGRQRVCRECALTNKRERRQRSRERGERVV
jgi:hypothetical protein